MPVLIVETSPIVFVVQFSLALSRYFSDAFTRPFASYCASSRKDCASEMRAERISMCSIMRSCSFNGGSGTKISGKRFVFKTRFLPAEPGEIFLVLPEFVVMV